MSGFWEPLAALLDHAVTEGFVHPDHRSLVLTQHDPRSLLDAMERHAPPETKKWLDPEEL